MKQLDILIEALDLINELDEDIGVQTSFYKTNFQLLREKIDFLINL